MLEEIDSLIDDVFKADPRLEALFAGAAVGRKLRKEAIDKVFSGPGDTAFWKFLPGPQRSRPPRPDPPDPLGVA